MRLVVDASVAIKWLLDEVGSPLAHHFRGPLRYEATYYDAAYVALALQEGIPLLAADGPMTQKFNGVVEFVKLQADFAGEPTGA